MHIDISQGTGKSYAVKVIKTVPTYEKTSNEHLASTATVRTPSVAILFGESYIIHHRIIYLENVDIYIESIYLQSVSIGCGQLWKEWRVLLQIYSNYIGLSEWQRFEQWISSILKCHCDALQYAQLQVFFRNFESEGILRCPECMKCTKLPEGCDGTRPRNTCSAAVSTSEGTRISLKRPSVQSELHAQKGKTSVKYPIFKWN